MGFLQLLQLFLSIFPEVMNVVKAIETQVPQAGAGAQKLATALSAVQAVTLSAPDVLNTASVVKTAVKVGDIPGIVGGLTHIISSVVSLFNATGAFQKSSFVQGVTQAMDNKAGTN